MTKIAFTFPGQGAQYVGMGQAFYESYEESRKAMDLASEVTGFSIPALCFEENDKIHITEYTQIAMLSVSAAILEVLKKRGLTPYVSAGLSLGEYGALLSCGAISMEDAYKVVRKRGIYMQEAYPEGGAMAAVLGIEAEAVRRICEETEGLVSVANYNCPGQIVITGAREAVEAAGAALKEAGAKRVLPLKVSGPFHSALLTGAGEKLREALKDVTIRPFDTPYVTNVTGEFVRGPEEVKELLVRQVSSSVLWQQSVEAMLADGVDTFVEIGPGRTLTGFLRKIDRNAKGYHIEKPEDMEALFTAIG